MTFMSMKLQFHAQSTQFMQITFFAYGNAAGRDGRFIA